MSSIENRVFQAFARTNEYTKIINSRFDDPVGRASLSRIRSGRPKMEQDEMLLTGKVIVDLLDQGDSRERVKALIFVPERIALDLISKRVSSLLTAINSNAFQDAVEKGYISYAAIKPLKNTPWEKHAMSKERPEDISPWFQGLNPEDLPQDPHDREEIGANLIMKDIVPRSELEVLTSISLCISREDIRKMYGHLLKKNNPFLNKVYAELESLLTNNPITPFLLIGQDAVDKWRTVTGPEQDPDKSSPEHFRYTFSTKYHPELHREIVVNNGVHGSRPDTEGPDRYSDLKNDLKVFQGFLVKLKDTCEALLKIYR